MNASLSKKKSTPVSLSRTTGQVKPSSSSDQSGVLHVVSTPIGNLKDISQRALDVLNEASFVFCEDTRVTGKLKSLFGFKATLRSCYEHNELGRVSEILHLLEQGHSVALVSDAGTPTISDPGFRLIRACQEAGFRVSPIPGPSALIAALSISGFPSDSFYFGGFLPPKKGKRRAEIQHAISLNTTVIWYESTHRILSSLELLEEITPTSEIFLARELTKLYEDTLRGTVAEVRSMLIENKLRTRGEFVLILKAVGK